MLSWMMDEKSSRSLPDESGSVYTVIRCLAEARGDRDACMALPSDEIVWMNNGATKVSGTYSGKQVLPEELLGPLLAQLKAGIASELKRLTAEGDIVIAQTTGTAETVDGKHYNNSCSQVMRVEDGKIAGVKASMDTALIVAVFGE